MESNELYPGGPYVEGAGDPDFSSFAGGFDPLSVSPRIWVKADAGTYQAAGGAAAALDGDVVGQWQDQSGNGRHFAMSTGANKPTLQLNERNGLPVIRADGTDDQLRTGVAMSNLIANNAYELFAIASFVGIGTNGANIWENDCLVGDSSGFFGVFAKSGGPLLVPYNWDGDPDGLLAAQSIATGTFYTIHQRHAGGNLILSVNNGAETSTPSGNTPTLTGTLDMFKTDVPVAAQIDVLEFLITPALTPVQRAAMMEYLRARGETW